MARGNYASGQQLGKCSDKSALGLGYMIGFPPEFQAEQPTLGYLESCGFSGSATCVPGILKAENR